MGSATSIIFLTTNNFVTITICLSYDKQTFIARKYFSHDNFVTRKIFSHDKHNSVFVATKMILVAAPSNATTDNCLSVAWRTAGVAGHTGSLVLLAPILTRQVGFTVGGGGGGGT